MSYNDYKNSMVKNSIFRAYDIRGKYLDELNEKNAFEIAKSLLKIFKGKIVVGCDARLSSPALYKAVLNGLNSRPASINIIETGMITTPMLYFLVNKLKAGGGVMVTASHNPKEYNGLKIVGEKAKMISGKEIEKLLKRSI